jgi:hypothetical protein
MSANRVQRSKDEANGRTANQAAVGATSTKNPMMGTEGLYKPGFPHVLGLLGMKPEGLNRRTEAESGFAAGSDPEELHRGRNLDLYA